MQVQIALTEQEANTLRRLAQLTEKLYDSIIGVHVLEEIMMNSGVLKTVASIDSVRLVMEPGIEPWLMVGYTIDNKYTDVAYIRCSPSGYAGTHVKIGT